MGIHDQLGHTENFSTKVKRVAKSRFLPFFCGQGLYWFQIEIVIQMQIVQILAMDQQIKHVVALSANLNSCFNPIQLCILEELGILESFEQAPLLLWLWLLVMEAVENPAFE